MPQLEDEASATNLQKEKVKTQKDERVRVRVSSYLRNQSPAPEKTRATQGQDRIKKDDERRWKRDGEADSHVYRQTEEKE